jgi:hypothetical protein
VFEDDWRTESAFVIWVFAVFQSGAEYGAVEVVRDEDLWGRGLIDVPSSRDE